MPSKPKPPCIYALRHKPTGKLYVGSTVEPVERRKKWWHRFNSGEAPSYLREIGPRAEWEFVVIESLPGATPEALQRREAEVVNHIRSRAPEKLLNKLAVQRGDAGGALTAGGETRNYSAWSRATGVPRPTILARLKRGWTPEEAVGLVPPPPIDRRGLMRAHGLRSMAMQILDKKGNPMLLIEAAEALGVRKETVEARLEQFRVKGITSVKLHQIDLTPR